MPAVSAAAAKVTSATMVFMETPVQRGVAAEVEVVGPVAEDVLEVGDVAVEALELEVAVPVLVPVLPVLVMLPLTLPVPVPVPVLVAEPLEDEDTAGAMANTLELANTWVMFVISTNCSV